MKVLTIGLGYIGLPTSILIASKSIEVVGVDINKEIVEKVNKGEIHISEPNLKLELKSVLNKKYFKASYEVEYADVYLIVVPTPFKKGFKPDLSYVEAATRNVIPFLKEGDLFIIESTSPVGTTEKMRDIIYALRPDLIDKIFIAYCPERVLPGNILFELKNNDRIVGGINEISSNRASLFYKFFVEGDIYETNSRTAEMCKLVENASRDSQIAFANEVSMICHESEINPFELISLANKHPRVNILNPGCGVGGHCIAVDPYFLIDKFPETTSFISQARKVNIMKTEFCLNIIIEKIKNFMRSNDFKPKVAVCGLTYKANVDDIRESPALKIYNLLKDTYGESIKAIDPYVESTPNLKVFNIDEIKKCDLIVKLVSHKEFELIKCNENQEYINFLN